MKKCLLITLFIFFKFCAGAQNLVSNPSFENYVTCPDVPSNIPVPNDPPVTVTDWYRPSNGSSDYFNICAPFLPPFPVSIPENFAGYQLPRTGDAYAGMYGNITYATFYYREYLEAPLTATLEAGHRYFVSYWISLGEMLNNPLSGIDQFGAHLSNDYISVNYPSEILVTPQVVSPVGYIYTDTIDWRSVSGTFTAEGDENWITIGNFTPYALLNEQIVTFYPLLPDPLYQTYYYVDDVCVLDIEGPPTNILIHDTVMCSQTTDTLTGRTGMANYLWDDGSLGTTRIIDSSGTFWVKSVNKENCEIVIDTFYISLNTMMDSFSLGNDTMICSGTSLLLSPDTAPATVSFLWQDGSTLPQFEAVTGGQYWLKVSDACDSRTDTINIASFNPFVITKAACKNDHNGYAFVNNNSSDISTTYLWVSITGDTLSYTDTMASVPSGNYILYATNSICDITINVFVPEEDYRVSFYVDSIICYGAADTFINTSVNQFTSYEWDFGNGAVSAQAAPVYTYPAPGNYMVRLIGHGSICTDTAYQQIIVDPVSGGSFVSQPDRICMGQYIDFQTTIDSTVTGQFWSFGDGNTMSAALNQPLSRHAYDSAGIMPVVLTTSFRACPDVLFTHEIYVEAPPKVYLGPDTGLCLHGEPILLKNLQDVPAGNFSQEWSTGDTTAILKVVHPGLYSLRVSTQPLGCTTTEQITINKDCYIDIPNAFTPNGDGVNDYFFPRQMLSRKITDFRMQLFNRWGQIVFETTNTDGRGWDGKFNGKDQPGGVYLYLIEASIDGLMREKYKGNVTLIR